MSQTDSDFTYDELNFDGLERRGNYRLIAYREDVLHALDRKDPAAIIYQIVYRWQTEFKKPEVLKKVETRKKAGLKPYTPKEIEDMMYVYMSYNDFVRETGGAIGYNTVIRMLDFLVNTKKVLNQRENHDPKYADFEYSVNKTAMRQLLKALPVEPAFAPKIPKKKSKSTQMGIADTSTQMGTPTEELASTQMGTGSTQEGIASTQMGTEVYPFGGTSHNTHNNPHNYTHKSERSASDSIDPVISSETDVSSEPTHHILPQEASPIEDKQDNTITQATAPTTETPPAYSQQSAEESPVENKRANRGKKEGNGERRAAVSEKEKPAGPPQMPPSEMQWGTTKCLKMFDAWRGAPLIGKYKLGQASESAKGLATHYSEEQVRQVRNAMENDEYYITRGGTDICDVANNIARYLKKMNQQSKPAGVSANRSSSPNGYQISSFDDPEHNMDGQFFPSEAEKMATRKARKENEYATSYQL